MEEINREVITRDILKKDAKSILVYSIFRNIFVCLVFMLALLPFYMVYYLFSDVPVLKINIVFSAIELAIGLPFVIVIIRCVKMLWLLKKDCFNIITDKVCDKKTNWWLARSSEIPTRKPLISWGLFKTGLILCFEKYKKYDVAIGEHYNFSEINKMMYLQQFWSTEICDEFYLFTIDNKIIEIYNTKIFELQE